jgi:hypothetical protein
MARKHESGRPGTGAVHLLVSETAIPRPIQLRLCPPGRDPICICADMTPDEAHTIGMDLINAADQARAQFQEVTPGGSAD